jgi:hypothetical protein
MIRTILVPLTAEVSGATLLDAALVLARRVNSHIRALFILPDPDAALAYRSAGRSIVAPENPPSS